MFIYKIKGFHLGEKIKERFEEEMGFLFKQFQLQLTDKKIHIDLEMLKNNQYLIKVKFWLVSLKKNIVVIDQQTNIYTAINQIREKIGKQISKIKEKNQQKKAKR